MKCDTSKINEGRRTEPKLNKKIKIKESFLQQSIKNLLFENESIIFTYLSTLKEITGESYFRFLNIQHK